MGKTQSLQDHVWKLLGFAQMNLFTLIGIKVAQIVNKLDP